MITSLDLQFLVSDSDALAARELALSVGMRGLDNGELCFPGGHTSLHPKFIHRLLQVPREEIPMFLADPANAPFRATCRVLSLRLEGKL